MSALKTIEQKKRASLKRRQKRVRAKVKGNGDRPRLFVYKSNKNTESALIDDVVNKTLFTLNTADITDKKKASEFAKVEEARELGRQMAKFALDKGIKKIVFDRGGNLYSGRVKAVAEGAREGGLEF